MTPIYLPHATLRLQVGDDGSVIGPRGRPLKWILDRAGYPKINTYDAGRWKQHPVHRLVCETHHGDRPEGMVVRHLDGDPLNCSAINLRWGTPEENEADKIAHGTALRGSSHHRAKLSEEQVHLIRDAAGRGVSNARIAEVFGVSKVQIGNIVNRRNWRHI
jgi:hypothetical protein